MTSLQAQKEHLANLLTAIQCIVYFLSAADRRLAWPLDAKALETRKKDEMLYQQLAAFNERYAKLQDILGSAMRHVALLSGERTDEFLRVLAWFEKQGVLDSVEDWQAMRIARNQAAHEYETDYRMIAKHFDALHAWLPTLFTLAGRLVALCEDKLHVMPSDDAFAAEFVSIAAKPITR